ncbi:N-6 DNA methylase [Rubinisphaera sp.]
MITGQLKSQINKLWEEFWTGGITNPLTVIEQVSFLMFARLLDMRESTEEKKWSRKNPGKPFPGVYFPRGKQHLRWSHLKQEADADKVLKIVRDEVFPHFRVMGQEEEASANEGPKNTFNQYMKDATLMINKPSLLMSAINMIEALPLTQGDTKGDLYEYLLGKLTTAGINGQFRTPRHVIDLMVDLVLAGNEEESISWTVGDPACGTGGFLVQFMEALREHFTSPDGIHVDEETGGKTYTGDLITPQQWKHIKSDMFHGFDFDVTMLRIAAMNMMLHEIDTPDINYQDTLSTNFTDRKETRRWAEDAFDLILANPPFKGSLDEEDVHKSLTGKVKTKKTELLFIVLMLRMLKLGGRCAVIVPDGILDKADAIRRKRQEAESIASKTTSCLFYQEFGDPLFNPKEWNVVELDTVSHKITDGVHFKPTYTDAGIPFVSVKDITTGQLKFDNAKFVSEESHAEYIKRCHPERGDVLLTKVGATYGRPALVDTDRPFSIYVSVALIKPDRSKIDPIFLKEVLASDELKRQADRAIKGAGVPDLHLVEIRKFRIPLPPLKVQDEFVATSRAVHALEDKLRTSTEQYNDLFNSLVQRAFKGEL